jgi:hypothetical protein
MYVPEGLEIIWNTCGYGACNIKMELEEISFGTVVWAETNLIK